MRTSTNFAHLASFQAIEFMDWPVPKTLDIIVCAACQTSENKAVKTQHSVVCKERSLRTGSWRGKRLPLQEPVRRLRRTRT